MAGMEEMVQIGFPFPFPFTFLFASLWIPGSRTTGRDRPGRRVNGTLNGRRDRAAGAGQRKS